MQFGKIAKGYLLIGVSPLTTITTPRGGPLYPVQELRSHRAEVRADGDVPLEYVYERFTRRVGKDTILPPYGTVYHGSPGDKTTVHGAGRFVAFDALKTVDVPFTYQCGGTATRGTVASWRITMGGLIECGEPIAAKDPMHDLLDEVAHMRC